MSSSLPDRAALPLGDEAVLIECAGLADVAAVAAWCASTQAAADSSTGAVLEIVPGAATVMIRGLPLGRLLALASTVPALLPPVDNGDGDEVRIPVLYRGEDLAATAEAAGVSIERLVGLHTSARWTVAFVGFAPGFGYLHSPDWGLQIPRHGIPRTSVPAGAVALADGFSGVYPRSSPGGWQLIGSTDAPLWDVDRVPPALLRPGTSVRFDELR